MNADNCPRCTRGHIDAFAHVEGGRCFLCGGSGEGRYSVSANTFAPTASPTASKHISTSILGDGYITRHGGGFMFEAEDGVVYFDVVGGRVCNVMISDGMVATGCTEGMARKALQAAYKPARAAA